MGLTKAEYAQRVGVSERTLTRWLNDGLLDEAGAVLVDGVWRIPPDAPKPDARGSAARRRGVMTMSPAMFRDVVDTAVSAPEVAVAVGRFWWTVDELVELWAPHVTRYAVGQMLDAGEIRGYRRGPHGAWLVPTGELRRLMG